MTDYIDFTLPEQLNDLAQKVRQIMLDTGHFLAESTLSSIRQKEGHANFVTDMDVKVQEMLVKALTPLVPGAVFLLEESDTKPDITKYAWIIDPIDGTQNFINQYRMSAISVGFVRGHEGLIGTVYNPFMDELFIGIKNHGATLNDRPIQASDKPMDKALISIGTSPYYEELHAKSADALAALYPLCADFRRTGSAALDLCYIACARQDGYFEYRLSPWDYAGASVILNEAGGKISQIGHTDWDYTRSCGIAAGNPRIFDEFLAIIER